MDRYAVFIDGGYAKKIPDRFDNKRISYLKFSDQIGGRQERLRTYYYDCAPYVSSPPTTEEKARKAVFDRFVARLECESRFQVRLGALPSAMTQAALSDLNRRWWTFSWRLIWCS